MPLFINEDRKELGKKQIPIPKSMQKHLQKTRDMYKGYDSNPGYKRLKKYTEEEPYNDRSNGKQTSGKDIKTISFSDAKRTLSDMTNTPNKKGLKYILNGGHKMEEFLSNAIKQARGANQVKKVKPVPKLENPKPPTPLANPKQLKAHDGTIRLESKTPRTIYLSEDQIKRLKGLI